MSYLPVGGDAGFTIRVVVTASNSAGSASASSAATATVTAASSSAPPGFTSVVTDAGCSGCSVTVISNGLQATIAGGADSVDTAYGLADFGGASGLSGRVYTRDLLAFAPNETLSANAALFQVRDVADALVYELYATPARTLLPLEPSRRPASRGDQRLHHHQRPQ